jgi:hypothetical protein
MSQTGVAVSNQIEVDDDVFGLLKGAAEPFVDTPNSVLRRLLGLNVTGQSAVTASRDRETAPRSGTTPRKRAGASSTRATTRRKTASKRPAAKKRTRAARGTLLPEDRYQAPLLRALVDAGGQAPYREIVDAVGRELKSELLPADFETLDSGTVRWQSRLQFVRLRLIERGYLDRETPRGIWGITDEGRHALTDAASS